MKLPTSCVEASLGLFFLLPANYQFLCTISGKINYEEATVTIGTLPSLASPLNVTNIRALTVDLVNTLLAIPSPESTDLGFSSLVLSDEI